GLGAALAACGSSAAVGGAAGSGGATLSAHSAASGSGAGAATGTTAATMATTAASTGTGGAGADLDGDGLGDALEQSLASDYFPFLLIHPNDKCPRHGVLFRASPHPAAKQLVALWYDVL